MTPSKFIRKVLASLLSEKDFAKLRSDTLIALDSPTEGTVYVYSDDGGKTFGMDANKYDKRFKSVGELLAFLTKHKFSIAGYEGRER